MRGLQLMSIYQNSLSLRPGPWPGSTRCNEDNSSWLPHTAPTDQTQVISAGQCNNVSPPHHNTGLHHLSGTNWTHLKTDHPSQVANLDTTTGRPGLPDTRIGEIIGVHINSTFSKYFSRAGACFVVLMFEMESGANMIA